MFDFINSIFLLFFIAMILSAILGARPDSMIKLVADIVLGLISIAFKLVSEFNKFALELIKIVLVHADRKAREEEEKPDYPFPRKPRRKRTRKPL